MISRTADFGYSSAITALWLIFKTWIVWKTAVGLVQLLSFNCGFGLLRFWWWSDLSKEIGIYGCWTLLLKRASRLPSFRCSFWVFRGVFFWKHVETTISPCQKAENKRLTPILLGDKNLSFFRWLLDCIMAHQGRHFMDILEPTLGNLIREVIPGAPKRQKVGECWECFGNINFMLDCCNKSFETLYFFWKTEVIQFQNVISGSGPNSLTALETGSFCNGKRCCGRLAAPWTW